MPAPRGPRPPGLTAKPRPVSPQPVTQEWACSRQDQPRRADEPEDRSWPRPCPHWPAPPAPPALGGSRQPRPAGSLGGLGAELLQLPLHEVPACRKMEGASPGRNSQWGAQTPRETRLEVQRSPWGDQGGGASGQPGQEGCSAPALLPSSGPEAGLAAQVTPEPRASGQRWAREEQPVS